MTKKKHNFPTETLDSLLNANYSGINGPDITCSSTWVTALIETHLSNKQIHWMAIIDEYKTTSIFPYFTEKLFLERRIKSFSEVYAGRSSLLGGNGSISACSKLIQEFPGKIPYWDTLQLTLVDSCVGHFAIYYETTSGKSLARNISTIKSPYIDISRGWPETFDSLPKKLRWTIRKGENDLNNLGSLTYRQYTTTKEINELFLMIYKIEKESWKEHAGSSITKQHKQQEFYETLAKYAANDKILSAHILLLDDKPLAYILGLISGDGSFLDLKESFVDSYSKYSPSHVLKSFAIANLIKQCVRIYDFMGDCEPYKMRWTDKVYERHTIVIYNKTVRGRLAYFKSLLTRGHKSVPAPSKLTLAPQ